MDPIDRKLINRIQRGIPLVPSPFAAIGKELGIKEEEVLSRLHNLRDRGLIRRLGAFFDPVQMGYVSTLCAAKCPPDKEPTFIAAVNALPQVTHNYRRTGEYQFWFTIIAPTEEDLERIITSLKMETDVPDIISLRVKRRFKIDAKFEV